MTGADTCDRRTPVAKKKADRPKDQHKSGFMVRLPEWHRAVLEGLKAKNRRPITAEVQIALERHYKAEGVKFPPPG
jgi:hypothetical protein